MGNGEGPDWSPERERRETDPVEQARAMARVLAEEQERFEQRRQARQATIPPPPPGDLQMSVHRIQNGFVVIYGVSPAGCILQRAEANEEYAKDQADVHAILLRVLGAFFEKPVGTTSSCPDTPGQGTGPGPVETG